MFCFEASYHTEKINVYKKLIYILLVIFYYRIFVIYNNICLTETIQT